jgi:hypothetical protein
MKRGGGTLVGYIPVVCESTQPSTCLSLTFEQLDVPLQEKDRMEFINFRREVYHRAVDSIFQSLQSASHLGRWTRCGDGAERVLYPGILVAAADFEEQCVLLLI